MAAVATMAETAAVAMEVARVVAVMAEAMVVVEKGAATVVAAGRRRRGGGAVAIDGGAGGGGDPLAWHSGCVVRNTVKASEKDDAPPPPPLERWAIQIFKEHYVGEGGDPRGDIKGYPPPKAFYETMRAHAAAAGEDEKGKEEKPKAPPRATVAVIVSALLKSLAPHDVVGYIGIVGTIVIAVGIWLFSRRLPKRRKPKFHSGRRPRRSRRRKLSRGLEGRKLGRPCRGPRSSTSTRWHGPWAIRRHI